MEENGQSRIYLGIHWSFDKVQGINCGVNIADYNFAHILQPAKTGHGSNALPAAKALAGITVPENDDLGLPTDELIDVGLV